MQNDVPGRVCVVPLIVSGEIETLVWRNQATQVNRPLIVSGEIDQ